MSTPILPSVRKAPPSQPELGQRVWSPFAGLQTGPWSRWVDAKWLGAYTPANVQNWVRKLMRRDPQIKLGLRTVKAPFFGIDYRLEGGNPRVRAFVNKVLLETHLWNKLLWSLLNAIDFGYQCHELVWEVEDVEIEYQDQQGEQQKIKTTLERAFALKIISDIDPERIYPLVDLHGDMEGTSVDGLRFVPWEKLLHVVNNLEWKNWWGTAEVDSAYIPWYHNNFYYLFLARYLESKGNPVLKGTAPWDSRFTAAQTLAGQVEVRPTDYLAQQAMALQGGSNVIFPWEPDDKGNNMWSLEELEVSNRTEAFLPIIQHNETMKLRGVLVPERIATQDSSVGSYASSDIHLDVFYGMLEVFKNRLILEPINEQLIPRLVRYNFGKSAPVPRVNASELNRDNKQLLGDLIKAAITAPRKTKDGRVYNIADMLDVSHALASINMPHFKPDEVAHPEDPVLDSRAAGWAQEKLDMDPETFRHNLVNAAENAARAKAEAIRSVSTPSSMEGGKPKGVSLANEGSPSLPSIHIHVPKLDPPRIEVRTEPKVEVNVPETLPPVIHVAPSDVNVDVAAPNVTVESPSVTVEAPNISVAAPQVNVSPRIDIPAKSPAHQTMSFKRDSQGRITGAEIGPDGTSGS